MQTLRGKIGGHLGQTGQIAARLREAFDQTRRNRVPRRRHDDRDGLRRPRGGGGVGIDGSDDHIGLEAQQIGDNFGQAVVMTVRVAVFELDIAAFDPAELPQPLPERLVPWLGLLPRERR